MFAIIESGGKQYRVSPGSRLTVERLRDDPGSAIAFERVLMISDGDRLTIGKPVVEGARVVGHVLEHARGQKIIVFKYKAKSNYRRKSGHRQELTRVRIAEIVPDQTESMVKPAQ
ncbi:MAG: 50S ribosomal protein L21 [Chloroflexi bacterium]|nr:50S ribosomal protein L21 [Chloroflexota bacterium]